MCGCSKKMKGQTFATYKGKTMTYIGAKTGRNYGIFENGKSYWIDSRDFNNQDFSR